MVSYTTAMSNFIWF